MAAKREKHLVSLMDLPITLMTAAGLSPLPGMSGRPLQLLTNGTDWDDVVYMQISESHLGRAIRTPKWKYAVGAPECDGWNDIYASRYMECYLYDLENDPYERTNLINDSSYAAIRQQLRNELMRKMKEAGEPDAEIVPFYSQAYFEHISEPG